MVVLDSTQIQKIIPHRYPMLLIDRVDELEPGKKAVATRNVTIHEEVFNGHFPDNPVMPGVLIVEALAQTGAVALLSMLNSRARRLILAAFVRQNSERSSAPAIR